MTVRRLLFEFPDWVGLSLRWSSRRRSLCQAIGKLGVVEIDMHLDASIGSACERLDYRPVRQNIGRKVDFVPRCIDQCDVHMLEVFGRGIADDRRGIGAAWRALGREAQRPVWES